MPIDKIQLEENWKKKLKEEGRNMQNKPGTKYKKAKKRNIIKQRNKI